MARWRLAMDGTRIQPKKRKNKYNARPKVVDGITFASAQEAKRYVVLKFMQQAGEITELALQPEFDFVINDFKVCTYKADFRYRNRVGEEIIEDVKSEETRKNRAYRIKHKLMIAVHGIHVLETF